jgi:serine protease Do
MHVAIALAALSVAQPNPRRTPVVEVVEKAGPAVVNIGAEVEDLRNPFQQRGPVDDLWREFFTGPRAPRRERSESLGSGVIIDPSGLILTNEHVVSRASAITITLADRRTFRADVVGADPSFDVAVLRIRGAKDLPVVAMGTSADLMPGEPAIAIGNPFGLSNTVTTGVVSALHRSITAGERTYEDFVQTDAAINPGNSGGALLNIEGKLIGVNTAVHAGGTGIGFAIPIDKALAVVDEVLLYGEVRPVHLGVEIDPRSARGARVVGVAPDGPAARAGLQPGDVLVDIGGQEIADARGFGKIVRGLVPGQAVVLQYVRGAARSTVKLEVKELTAEKAAAMGRDALGIDVKLGRDGYLVITSVRRDSDAARVGIRRGDLLLSVAGRPLRSEAEFSQLCAAIREAQGVAVIIGRGGRRYYVTLRLR